MGRMKDKSIDLRNRQMNLDAMWADIKTKVTKKTFELFTNIVALEIKIEKDSNM